MRRGPTSGRFLPKPVADALPLFMRPAKSAPHVAGHRTRKAKRAAWVAAHIERIRETMA